MIGAELAACAREYGVSVSAAVCLGPRRAPATSTRTLRADVPAGCRPDLLIVLGQPTELDDETLEDCGWCPAHGELIVMSGAGARTNETPLTFVNDCPRSRAADQSRPGVLGSPGERVVQVERARELEILDERHEEHAVNEQRYGEPLLSDAQWPTAIAPDLPRRGPDRAEPRQDRPLRLSHTPRGPDESCVRDQGCIALASVAREATVPDVLTIKAAAELLGVSEQTLRRWDKAGKLRARRHPMNGYRLYPRKLVLNLRRQILSPTEAAR